MPRKQSPHKHPPHKEQDLYRPVKILLEGLGFVVKGEIKNCDITAVRQSDGELWIVELKLAFNMKLLLQAVKRQNIVPNVLVAIPRKKNQRKHDKDQAAMMKILKRQGLGLITVALDSPAKHAEMVLAPGETGATGAAKNKKTSAKAAALLKEFNARTFDIPGGSATGATGATGAAAPRITAYKERCIQIAVLLSRPGVASPKQLVELGCGKDTGAVLRANYYGWFERVERGKYGLSEVGRFFLEEYKDNEVVRFYFNRL